MSRPEPLLPKPWNANRLSAVCAAATIIPLFTALAERGVSLLVPLAVALCIAMSWQVIFAHFRDRPVGFEGLLTSIVVVLLIPDAPAYWQLGLSLSFGLVMGDLVFGGRGRGFLNPAAVALAFFLFSFSPVQTAVLGMATSLAGIASGGLLLIAGILSWRVIAGFAIAVVAASVPSAIDIGWIAVPHTTLTLGLVFLIGDPVAAACTNAGRWVYGLLAGGLMVLLGHAGGDILSSLVFAALLASIFAPLIDQVVVWANVRRISRRQGRV